MTFFEILGLIAASCTTISFIPQAFHTVRTMNTHSISIVSYILINIGVFLWLIYGILIGNLPITLANGLTFPCCFVVLMCKIANIKNGIDVKSNKSKTSTKLHEVISNTKNKKSKPKNNKYDNKTPIDDNLNILDD